MRQQSPPLRVEHLNPHRFLISAGDRQSNHSGLGLQELQAWPAPGTYPGPLMRRGSRLLLMMRDAHQAYLIGSEDPRPVTQSGGDDDTTIRLAAAERFGLDVVGRPSDRPHSRLCESAVAASAEDGHGRVRNVSDDKIAVAVSV